MNKFLQLLAILCVALFATQAWAYNPPPSPKPSSNIVDQAHVLSPSDLHRLNVQLNQINQTSANEIGVLIVPSLQGEDIRDVGIATGKAWGVGKRDLDNGVMIVWSPGDRKIGIETGKGVEGDLPDLKCNDIIRNVMGPNFRQHRYVEGLGGAFTAISQNIADHRAELAERDRRAAQNNSSPQAVSAGGSNTAPRSGGCEISSPNQAGFGGFLMVALLLVLWVGIRRLNRNRIRASQEQEEQTRQRAAHLRKLHEDKIARTYQPRVPSPAAPPVSIPPHSSAIPIMPHSTAAFVDYEAERRARQAREEEQERQEAANRRARQQQEEDDASAAAAVGVAAVAEAVSSVFSNDDTPSYDSGSSSSGSDYSSPDPSPPDFGGGDFGGGGSSDSY